MKLRSLYLTLWMLILCAFVFTSCSDDDDDDITVEEGIYVLNNGNFGNNNSTITYYDPVTQSSNETDIYGAQNLKGLGDSGQDILVQGKYIYLAVYGSNRISVMTRDFVEVASVALVREGQPQSPRSLAYADGKVYVSLFDGYVAKINTSDFKVEAQVKVGRNPEGVAISGGKLFVANSGGMDHNTPVGYDKTVSVVNLKTFEVDTTIDVALNPTVLTTVDNGDIYCISMGNYGDVPNTLQKIDPETYGVTFIGNATEMTTDGKKLYLMYSQYDANWNQVISYPVYDTESSRMLAGEWIADASAVVKPYKVSYEPVTKCLYLTSSDYTNNGDVYVYKTDGTLVKKFGAGLNPLKVVYVK